MAQKECQSAKPSFDCEDDDNDWQMECNQGCSKEGTANAPPGDQEGTAEEAREAQKEHQQSKGDDKRKLTADEERRIGESRGKTLKIRRRKEDDDEERREEGKGRKKEREAGGEEEEEGKEKKTKTGAKQNSDCEEDASEWQMECNQGRDAEGTANVPPENHEGMDTSEWLATTCRAKWITKDSSHGKQETGKQIRSRITKQRKDQQEKVTKEGMDRGCKAEKWQTLFARTRGRLGTTDQGGGEDVKPHRFTKILTKATREF